MIVTTTKNVAGHRTAETLGDWRPELFGASLIATVQPAAQRTPQRLSR